MGNVSDKVNENFLNQENGERRRVSVYGAIGAVFERNAKRLTVILMLLHHAPCEHPVL
jgi:hypothetical protein